MEPSIKYVTIFWTNFDPLPCHTLSHISGPPKVRRTSRTPFLVVHAYIHMSLQAVCFSSRGFLSEVLSGRFGPGWSLSSDQLSYDKYPDPYQLSYDKVSTLTVTVNCQWEEEMVREDLSPALICRG